MREVASTFAGECGNKGAAVPVDALTHRRHLSLPLRAERVVAEDLCNNLATMPGWV